MYKSTTFCFKYIIWKTINYDTVPISETGSSVDTEAVRLHINCSASLYCTFCIKFEKLPPQFCNSSSILTYYIKPNVRSKYKILIQSDNHNLYTSSVWFGAYNAANV